MLHSRGADSLHVRVQVILVIVIYISGLMKLLDFQTDARVLQLVSGRTGPPRISESD